MQNRFIILSTLIFFLQNNALAQTPSFIRSKTITAPMCGVASVNIGSGPQCGEPTFTWINSSSSNCNAITASDSRCSPKEYNVGRGEACGVERYKSGKGSKECGSNEQEYWTEWCPNKSGCRVPVLDAVLVCYDEFKEKNFGPLVGIKLYSQKCKKITSKTCRHAKFGVELYKQCNIGVKSYNTCIVGYEYCRHPSHGEESRTYPSCQHESFGVNYNSCSVPDIENQKAEILRFEAELNSYKMAIDSLKSGSLPALQTLELSKQALNQNIFALQESLRFLNTQLTPELLPEARSFVEMQIADVNANLINSQNTISQINLCMAGNGTCDFAKDVAVKSIESQIENVRASLVKVREHLESEYSRLAGVAEEIRAQIEELLKFSAFSG